MKKPFLSSGPPEDKTEPERGSVWSTLAVAAMCGYGARARDAVLVFHSDVKTARLSRQTTDGPVCKVSSQGLRAREPNVGKSILTRALPDSIPIEEDSHARDQFL